MLMGLNPKKYWNATPCNCWGCIHEMLGQFDDLFFPSINSTGAMIRPRALAFQSPIWAQSTVSVWDTIKKFWCIGIQCHFSIVCPKGVFDCVQNFREVYSLRKKLFTKTYVQWMYTNALQNLIVVLALIDGVSYRLMRKIPPKRPHFFGFFDGFIICTMSTLQVNRI